MPKYTDIDLYLTKNELTNNADFKYDLAAISQSIKNIVLTNKKEKLFDAGFGGNVYDLLYNEYSDLELAQKSSELAAVIQLYEPRAIVTALNITDSGTGSWIVNITYSPVYDQRITKDIVLTVGSDK